MMYVFKCVIMDVWLSAYHRLCVCVSTFADARTWQEMSHNRSQHVCHEYMFLFAQQAFHFLNVFLFFFIASSLIFHSMIALFLYRFSIEFVLCALLLAVYFFSSFYYYSVLFVPESYHFAEKIQTIIWACTLLFISFFLLAFSYMVINIIAISVRIDFIIHFFTKKNKLFSFVNSFFVSFSSLLYPF